MTLDDGSAPPRRARRAQTGALPVVGDTERAETGILTIDTGPTPHPASTTAPVEVTAVPSSIAGAAVAPDETAAASDTLPAAAPGVAAPSARAATAVTVAATAASAVTAPTATASARTALAWVDERAVEGTAVPGDLTAAASPYVAVETDLLADAPRRSPLRAGVVVPTVIIAGLVGAYAGTTLLWPLHAVAPTVTAVPVQPIAAPAAAPAWPAEGSAAAAVGGIPGAVASASDPASIASITKVVTALVVLDEMPLEPGEQGPEYRFTGADNARYWQYRANGESALDVPVGGSLTEYQMLEGMLVGSANNYADRLAQTIWPSDAVFASAANAWLAAHGVPGIEIHEPTGMDPRNSASAESLIVLAERALANPIIAEIVAKPSVDLPGAGLVENTNELLADPGVVGLKTGTLDAWNLLSAKDVTIGDTSVRLYASVLGQPDDESRLAASRAIYTQLEQDLQLEPSVTAGTVAGVVETRWGEDVDIVTAGDASVILWNGGSGAVSTTYDLGDERDAGDAVGALTVDGPLDDAVVELTLAADVPDPSPWWRLTHPLDLFGLND